MVGRARVGRATFISGALAGLLRIDALAPPPADRHPPLMAVRGIPRCALAAAPRAHGESR
jgi:hypothetical protein